MNHSMNRILFWAVPVAALLAGLTFAFWPRPFEIDMVRVVRGPLTVSIAEEGQTRIRDVFLVSAPVRGRTLRLDVEVGEPVIAHQTVIAQIEPIAPEILNVRAEEEARDAAAAARAALALAKAEYAQAEAELDFATSNLARMRELALSGTISERVLEEAERAFRTRQAALETAQAGVDMREYELAAAEVQLLTPQELANRSEDCPCLAVRAPATGRVLRVLRESEGVVAAGEPLVEIGDPADMEIVTAFRSEDAVRIEAGQSVTIDGWGRDHALSGFVHRVEPFGFTKVSALGIEEQRVNVIIDIADSLEVWSGLGHGFRVDTRVNLWHSDDALKIPLTALFRNGQAWQVFEVREGVAHVIDVDVGQRTETEAQITAGLEEGNLVVRFPDDRLVDGAAVVERKISSSP